MYENFFVLEKQTLLFGAHIQMAYELEILECKRSYSEHLKPQRLKVTRILFCRQHISN